MTHIKTAEERMHPMCLDDKSVWCNAYFDEVQELRAALEQAQKKIEKLEIDNHGLIESKKSQYNLFMLNLKESNDRLNEACSDNNKKLELICKLKYEIDGMTDEAQLFKDRIAELEAQPIEPNDDGSLISISEHGEGQENECPSCGAEAGQMCSSSDGTEHGRKVHSSRQSAQPYQEPVAWISVEDRLPESGEIVDVCLSAKHTNKYKKRAIDVQFLDGEFNINIFFLMVSMFPTGCHYHHRHPQSIDKHKENKK